MGYDEYNNDIECAYLGLGMTTSGKVLENERGLTTS